MDYEFEKVTGLSFVNGEFKLIAQPPAATEGLRREVCECSAKPCLFGKIEKASSTGFDYRFDIEELKNPIIEILYTSGWTFEPKV